MTFANVGQRNAEDAAEKIGAERARGAEQLADVPVLVLNAALEPQEDDWQRVNECLIDGAN